MSAVTDRNLLAGLLALQLDFIDRDEMIQAMQAWVLDKSRDLESILVDQGALEPDTGELLSGVIRKHLTEHDSDPQKSLATLPAPDDALTHHVKELEDPELQVSLGHVTTDGRSMSPMTEAVSIGTAIREAGRYQILQSHRRGGLGEVFLARDTELERDVALKEIQPQFAADRDSCERFLMEARVTGGLDHPGIVPVHSLGIQEDGRPFYAMRFVRGETLHDAVKKRHQESAGMRRIDLHRLLSRFRDVCNAVHYAHSRGILHRDIKPGNIMIGPYGETLVVDWGLVKKFNRPNEETPDGGTEKTLEVNTAFDATQQGKVIGTPAYMSPEQASGNIDALGPASDIFSLGATLHFILTGKAPYEQKDTEAMLDDVRERRLATTWDQHPSVPPPLAAVCDKAMAKEPSQRYLSAGDLSADIDNWLADEPVSAWSEPWTVRSWRWIARHRTGITGTLAVVLAAFVALISFQNGLLREANEDANRTAEELDIANQELEDANRSLTKVSESLAEAKEAAERSNERNATAFASLISGLGEIGPEGSVAAVLLPTFESLDESMDGDPQLIRLATAFGEAFEKLGFYKEQAVARQVVYDTTVSESGKEAEESIVALGNLAAARLLAGERAEAVPLLEESVALSKEHLGERDPSTLSAMSNLGMAFLEYGDASGALPHLRDVLTLRREVQGDQHRETVVAMSNLATAYRGMGDFTDAANQFAQALEIQQAEFSDDLPLRLGLLNNLGMSYLDGGQIAEAQQLFEDAESGFRQQFGPGHPLTLLFLNNVALAKHVAGNTDESIPLFEEILETKKSVLPAGHPSTLTAYSNLANALDDVDRSAEAEAYHERCVAVHRAKSEGNEKAALAFAAALAMYARNQLLLEKPAEALKACTEALPVIEARSPDHWRHFDLLSIRGGALLALGQTDAAEPHLLAGYKGLELRKKTIPAPVSSRLPEAAARLVDLYEQQGDTEKRDTWQQILNEYE